jgi:uridine phosphorylase
MTTIAFQDQSSERLVFTAAEMLAHRWRGAGSPGIQPPEVAILCYQPDLMQYAARKYPVRRVKGFFGDVYQLKPSTGRVAIAGNFGIGAPAAAIMLEELAAFGVRQFISIGLAGGLQPSLSPGSVVVCDRAQRDEGTSGHYAPSGETVLADPAITQRLCQALALQGIPALTGGAWTTDAPYRETWSKVDAARQAGLLAVDMEAAALFAAGRALGVQVGAAFIIADPVLREHWLTGSELRDVKANLQRLLDGILMTMNGAEAR